MCGFHPPGRWYEIVADGGVPAGLRARRRGARARSLELGREQRPAAPTTAARSRACCATSSSARAGAPASSRCASYVGDGELDEDAFAEAVDADGVFVTSTDALAETTAGGQTELVSGDAELEEELGGLRFRISPEAFFQTNTEMAEVLYGIAAEFAALKGFERVYDLFCGIGTIGLTLAPRAGEVYGLEIVEPAVADAIRNARSNEIANARFFAGDVRLALRELVEEAGRPDVVVVDPPRAGMSPEGRAAHHRGRAAAHRLRLLQPDDAGAQRRAARRGRLRAGRVRPVDMFPQTPHIECVAVFDRVS